MMAGSATPGAEHSVVARRGRRPPGSRSAGPAGYPRPPCPAPARRSAAAGAPSGPVVSRRSISASTRAGSAPPRSILLMKIAWARPGGARTHQRTTVCDWTPSTADTTRTAASSTARLRSTSAMKSEWPGVSMRLTWMSPTANDATFVRTVMPRRRSMSIESVRVVPSSMLPGAEMAPASSMSRSVRLVLPASTCARMPRLMVCATVPLLQKSGRDCRQSSSRSHLGDLRSSRQVTVHYLPDPAPLRNPFSACS